MSIRQSWPTGRRSADVTPSPTTASIAHARGDCSAAEASGRGHSEQHRSGGRAEERIRPRRMVPTTVLFPTSGNRRALNFGEIPENSLIFQNFLKILGIFRNEKNRNCLKRPKTMGCLGIFFWRTKRAGEKYTSRFPRKSTAGAREQRAADPEPAPGSDRGVKSILRTPTTRKNTGQANKYRYSPICM